VWRPDDRRLARTWWLIELGVLVAIEAIRRLAYARRRLGLRAQGAVATWEYELSRPKARPSNRRS
jgi:hypothetical protein